MEEAFKSSIKFWKVLILPICIGLFIYCIPGIKLYHSAGMVILLYLFLLSTKNELIVKKRTLIVQKKYSLFNRPKSFNLINLNKVIYINRSDAGRGTNPQSKIQLYQGKVKIAEFNIVLTEIEIREFQKVMNQLDINFELLYEEKVNLI